MSNPAAPPAPAPASKIGRVVTERRGHVLTIALDRAAKRNAFDVPMFHDLARAYQTLDDDPELRCGVLHARGDHFTAGLELTQFAPVFATGKWEVPAGAIDPMGLSGRRLRKPMVAAVQGICLTIGIELLLATDVRVAADSARFGQIEVKRGIYPVGGATLRFPREIGWGNAMRWLLTGDEFDAREAHRIGLVQEVVPHGSELDRAIAIAEVIAAQAPLGVQATLASSRAALSSREEAAAERLLPDLQPILASEDVQEGIRSFVERRAANFSGK